VAMQTTMLPMVSMLEQVLVTAQATQNKVDDLPLADRVVEKDLLEVNTPHPLTPSPLHGEGELNHPTVSDETVVTE